MPNDETNSKTVKSVETALSILEALEAIGGATITELADRLDMSPGAVHHHLSTFRQHQYVVKRGGKYHIGLQFLVFGGKLGKQKISIS